MSLTKLVLIVILALSLQSTHHELSQQAEHWKEIQTRGRSWRYYKDWEDEQWQEYAQERRKTKLLLEKREAQRRAWQQTPAGKAALKKQYEELAAKLAAEKAARQKKQQMMDKWWNSPAGLKQQKEFIAAAKAAGWSQYKIDLFVRSENWYDRSKQKNAWKVKDFIQAYRIY